ncbi:hypothetical protein [Lysinibacillus fusiformis]|uniref:hypothetical protein n=1 Tax=Lysinibacillus fusiformis TaxID=28031 RepID=UPI00216647A7|nr:hypothetical protein [Lysinibacillus fusiformis]
MNIVSLLYGWIFFICMTLQLNYYRLLRLTGWTADNLDLFLLIVQLVGLSVATIFIYKLTVTWLGHRRWIYATMILWLPYTGFSQWFLPTCFPFPIEEICQYLCKGLFCWSCFGDIRCILPS